MKVVVTGASGFLGGHVVHALRAQGLDAVGVSRQHRGDLLHVERYADAPSGDVLIHLAEESVRYRAAAAGEAYVDACMQSLAALLDKPYGHVVYASTAVLYGDRNDQPRGIDAPIHAGDAYTRLKAASERAILQRGGAVARLSNLYGSGMSQDSVFGAILAQLPGEGDVTVQDDAPVRDFLWVGDAAAAFACLADRRHAGVFNVGTGTGTSVRELASLILRLSNQSHRRIVSGTPASASISNLVLDIRATLAELEWRPTTTLEQGLRQMLRPATTRAIK